MDLKKKLTLLAALVCTCRAGYLGSGNVDSYVHGHGTLSGEDATGASYASREPSEYVTDDRIGYGLIGNGLQGVNSEIAFGASGIGLSGIHLKKSATEVETVGDTAGVKIISGGIPTSTSYRDAPDTVVRDIPVPVPQPYAVYVPQPVAVPVEQPYPILVPVFRHIVVPVIYHKTVKVDKPIRVPVEKIVNVPVEKIVKVYVDNPVPVERLVEVPVLKKVHVPVHVVKHVPVPSVIEEVHHRTYNSHHNKDWW